MSPYDRYEQFVNSRSLFPYIIKICKNFIGRDGEKRDGEFRMIEKFECENEGGEICEVGKD